MTSTKSERAIFIYIPLNTRYAIITNKKVAELEGVDDDLKKVESELEKAVKKSKTEKNKKRIEETRKKLKELRERKSL